MGQVKADCQLVAASAAQGATHCFIVQMKDKLPAISIFARAGGEAWNKGAWQGPIRHTA